MDHCIGLRFEPLIVWVQRVVVVEEIKSRIILLSHFEHDLLLCTGIAQIEHVLDRVRDHAVLRRGVRLTNGQQRNRKK